ncbi:MAG: TetR/AcrR family transcriptional regulator [Atopobiaceae bacterium]
MEYNAADDSLLGGGISHLQDSSEDRRDAYVVACCATLCLQDGLPNVRMVDIANRAGVGVATLYRRFGSKTRIAIEAGTLLWKCFNDRIVQMVESDDFLAMNGAKRLECLLREYAAHYVANRDFVRFVYDFDHLMLSEGVTPEQLMAYGQEVDSFYIIFEDAYQLGVSDGSVRQIDDFRTFYQCVAHALMGLAQKLYGGDVIPSDRFDDDPSEIECLVSMAVRYIGA